MVEPKVVVPNKFAITAQPQPADVELLAEQGYRAIINNRPDGEKNDQPKAEEVREAARQQGLHYEHMPVTLESITREDVLAFRQSVVLAPDPVVAHCGTGKRSYILWAAGEIIDKGRGVDELITHGESIGVDVQKELPQVINRIS